MTVHPDESGNQINEQKLVRRAQGGDSEAFGVLYTLYLDPIYRYVYYRVDGAATAEDLTEEVFVRAWEALPSYRMQTSPFKSWLYRIAHNLVIDHRRKQRPTTIDDGALQRMSDPSAPLEQIVFNVQNTEALLEAVRQLDEEEQQVVILRFVEGLPHKEVAEIIRKSEEASRVIQHRAIQRLQRTLADREKSHDYYPG
jgi:RNA polymerase sigma-70 factor (ECF subfamily)